MPNQERHTFSLNIKTQKVLDFLEAEKNKTGESKTAIINKMLETFADWPIILNAYAEDAPVTDEIEAVRVLLKDELIEEIPEMARAARRSHAQMLLYLVEKGMIGEQPTAINRRSPYERKASA